MSEDVIRTEDVSRCPLCGNEERRILYAGLRDRLFGAPGEWTLKECLRCGLVFLDPRPLQSEIGKAYHAYYTHQEDAAPDRHDGPVQSALKMVVRPSSRLVNRILLISRERNHLRSMYLHRRSPGRLLDVGCGQGRFLDHIRRKGWLIEGVEPDPIAAEIARALYGIAVHVGELASAHYSDGYFDAITMNHVIEHVHNPVALLQECHRILRPGGLLVAVTPNIESWGHRKFGRDWRGLEPPRHLCLFSSGHLKRCAEQAGYNTIRTWTTAANVEGIFAGSLDIQTFGKHSMDGAPSAQRKVLLRILQYWEAVLTRLSPETGEENILWVEKE